MSWYRIAAAAVGLVVLSALLLAVTTAAPATVVDVRVGVGVDDVEQFAGGEMYLDSSDLDLVDADEGAGQTVGLRFSGLGIPQGAVVSSAWVQFEVDDETSVDTTTLTVRAQLGPATVFTTAYGDLSNRPVTVASVEWKPSAWENVRAAGVEQRTPELATVIQEVVNSAQWTPASSLVVVITGSGQRIASSFEGSPGGAPLLHVEYTDDGGPPSNAAPVVDAGPNRVVDIGGTAVLAVDVSDDGLPDPPAAVTVSWEQVSGPGTATFTDPTSLVTSVGFSASGTYIFRFTADDGALTATTDDVKVTVTDGEPPPWGVVRFAAVGDYGNGGGDAGAVANMISGQLVDFVITTGDNSYGNGFIDDHVGRFYSDYIGDYSGAYVSGSPVNRFCPSLGDNDYSDGAGLSGYLDYFTLPGAGVATSGTAPSERYYDFVQGPVHFFALNSNEEETDGTTANSAQAQWLQAGLVASTSPWKIVYFHYAPYSSGLYGPNPELQWPFEQWGADAILSGHDHVYERIIHGAVPYFITALGGESRYDLGIALPESQFFYSADDGALIVTACAASLRFEFHTVNSGIVDAHTVGAETCD